MSMTGLEDPIREQNVVCQRRSKYLTSNNLTERMIYCYVGTREWDTKSVFWYIEKDQSFGWIRLQAHLRHVIILLM